MERKYVKHMHDDRLVTYCSHSGYNVSLNCLKMNFFNQFEPLQCLAFGSSWQRVSIKLLWRETGNGIQIVKPIGAVRIYFLSLHPFPLLWFLCFFLLVCLMGFISTQNNDHISVCVCAVGDWQTPLRVNDWKISGYAGMQAAVRWDWMRDGGDQEVVKESDDFGNTSTENVRDGR